ncbi:hypothetical protein MSPP1_003364 [Malassezia sp. CBS 17886]|nr:hypothetical protein MSPP1_003364 [Malassezia sp. CBS 17886]
MAAWDSAAHAEWHLVRGIEPRARDACALGVLVAQGDFVRTLQSRTGSSLLASVAALVGPALAAAPGGGGVAHVVRALQQAHIPVAPSEHAGQLDALCVAIAALHAFLQLNWTGPHLELDAYALLRASAPQHFPVRAVDDDGTEAEYAARLHTASLDFLTVQGEPAYHLCDAPFLLVFAMLILDSLQRLPACALASLPWWRLRAAGVQRRIVDEPVDLSASIMDGFDAVARRLGSLSSAATRDARGENDASAWGHLHARALLESALALQRVDADREAPGRLVDAARASGLDYQLTGAPGKRTRFQREDKMQLVLLAESRPAADGDARAATGCQDAATRTEGQRTRADPGNAGRDERTEGADERTEGADERTEGAAPNTGWRAAVDPAAQTAHQPATFSLNDDTLLEQTQFTQTATTTTDGARLAHVQPGDQPPLAAADQCILLALCVNMQNTHPAHGLTAEQMGAFVDRVLPHPSNWSVHTMALLLRSRLEAHRTRTVERSALQLQALIEQAATDDSSVCERLRFFHALALPARWEMQAELANRFLALGVLRSALEIFERTELWERVVQCLGMLGRQTEAVGVVRDLLAGRKVEADAQLQQKRIASAASAVSPLRFAAAREAQLWCLLGDLEPQDADAHYQQAWSVSRASSARAARSLGALHFAQCHFSDAVLWLRRAVRINALSTRAWFMLGCSYMQLERWLEGAAAFRKCTALDDEDGESWNNLASCYLRLHQSQARRLDSVLEDEGSGESEGESAASASAASAASTSTARDSGIDLDSDADDDAPAGADAPAASGFELRMLAHRALGVSLKYSFESWRVWNNYMIVSVDVGELGEAARALARVVEIRVREQSFSTAHAQAPVGTADDGSAVVDPAVLSRLVDAVVRTPRTDTDAPVSRNEGRGLFPAVRRLFTDTLLPRFSMDPVILQSYARLLLWEGEYARMLDARVKSFRCGLGRPDADAIVTDRNTWLLAMEELGELVDLLENFGDRAAAPGSEDEAMPDWRFQARTLVRGFLTRTRDSFEDEDAWEKMESTLAGLRGGGGGEKVGRE